MKKAIVAVHVDDWYVQPQNVSSRTVAQNRALFDAISLYAWQNAGPMVNLYALREMSTIYSPLMRASPLVIDSTEGFDYQGLELKAQLIADDVAEVELCGISKDCCVRDIGLILALADERSAELFLKQAVSKDARPAHWTPQLFSKRIPYKILAGLTD